MILPLSNACASFYAGAGILQDKGKTMNLKEKPFYLNDRQEAFVYETLKGLTVEQKVGQLFCVMGQDYSDDELLALVKDYGIGGILFRPAPSEDIR